MKRTENNIAEGIITLKRMWMETLETDDSKSREVLQVVRIRVDLRDTFSWCRVAGRVPERLQMGGLEESAPTLTIPSRYASHPCGNPSVFPSACLNPLLSQKVGFASCLHVHIFKSSLKRRLYYVPTNRERPRQQPFSQHTNTMHCHEWSVWQMLAWARQYET